MRILNLNLNSKVNKFYLLTMYFSVLINTFLVAGCTAGGDLITPTPEKAVSIVVPIPVVVSPAEAVHYSNQNTLVVAGMCQSESTIRLNGLVDTQSVVCVNSAFSFTVNQVTDAINYYTIQQIKTDGSISFPVSVIWVRKSSVSQPVLNTPSSNPFVSSQAQLTIAGTCESEATISLSGDGAGSVICTNSAFSLNLPKSVDGEFNIIVTQTDKAGNTAQMNLVWRKYALTVTPQSATLPVNTDLPISITGGSGQYTLTLEQNNSGGSLPASSTTYTTGTLAGVVDQIKIVDSLGVQFLLNVTTVAGAVDHLSYGAVSGNNQVVSVNTNLPVSFAAQVVDEFENPIPFYPIYFRQIQGDGQLLDSVIQISDLTGTAYMSARSGHLGIDNVIEAGPVSSLLPDVAVTGRSKIKFSYKTTYTNKSAFGLTFKVGSNPVQVIARDINQDSHVDSIVLNNSDPSIGILLGVGNGLFSTMTKINSICINPISMAVGQIDSDSFDDIVIVCGSAAFGQGAALANVMQFFKGNGVGQFASAVNIPVAVDETAFSQVAIGDFNNDGHTDLALAVGDYLAATIPSNGAISFRFGNGLGGFTAPQYVETGKGTNGVVAGYFSASGNLDLAVINSTDNQLQFLFNNTITPGGSVVMDATNIYPVDLNPISIDKLNINGRISIAVMTGSGKLNLFNDDGAGGFNTLDSLDIATTVTSMTIADLNLDSYDDIIVTNLDDMTLSYFIGQSDGSFVSQPSIASVGTPISITTALVNEDNYRDILVVGADDVVLQIIPGRANGSFGFTQDIPANAGIITKSFAADYDGDGILDLAVLSAVDKNINILKGQNQGLFNIIGVPLDTNDNSTDIVAADLRKNGIQDIVVTNPIRNQVRVFLGLGNGGFSSPVDFSVGQNPNKIKVIDLNRDGYSDIIVTNGNSANIDILYGDGSGNFPTRLTKSVGANPTDLVITDINGDLALDIIVLARADSRINVLLGSGFNATYILSSAVNYDIGTDGTADPTSLFLHDVNNDSFLDILTTNSGDTTISVLRGNGDGSFQASIHYPAMDSPTGFVAGDFTGDGRLDVLAYSATTTSVLIFPGSAPGSYLTPSLSVEFGSAYSGLIAVDINNDKIIDLITFNNTGSAITTWLGH